MLNFIGIGSAFNTELGNTSAYIREKDTLLLIDCGGMVFDRINRSGMLDGIKNLYIIITHTHPDHIGSLGDLVFYFYYIKNVKATVIFPNSEIIAKLFENMGIGNDIYFARNSLEDELQDQNLGNVKLRFYPSSHVDNIPSYGIMISLKNKSIFYSGDSNAIREDVLEILKNGGIDVWYQDTCGADYEGNSHLSLRKLLEAVEPRIRSKFYCMHLDSWFNREEALKMGFNVVKIN